MTRQLQTLSSRVRLTLCRIALVGISLTIVGCSKPGPVMAPVQGVVTVNGKPKSGLIIRFMPDPQKGTDLPMNALGNTDASGHYELHYVDKGKEGVGAPVGWHRVVVEDSAFGHVPQGQEPPPRVVPVTYSSPATTPLSKEVKSGENKIDLEIGP